MPEGQPREGALYLDANASVPMLPEALAALVTAAAIGANPSSPHAAGRAARRTLDEARRAVAVALGGHDKDVVFTSGASEGNRWLVDAILEAHAEKSPHFVMSPLEHPSLRKPLERAAQAGRCTLEVLPLLDDGSLVLSEALLHGADAIFVTAAHNETGVVSDVAEVARLASPGALLAVDAAQAVGRLEPLPARVDAVVASAHKMGGPKGAGALLLRGNARRLPNPWPGGGQEGGRRPGTEALALVAAFGAAAAAVSTTRAQHARLAPLRDRLERGLLTTWQGSRAIGAAAARLPNTSAILVPGFDGEALRLAIDLAGVCVGFGSACSALAPEPSPALLAFGLGRDEARATLRLSLAPGDDEALVDEALRRLAGALPRRS